MASVTEIWPRRRLARGVLATTATITLLSVVVKAGTALRELLIAWSFGTSDAVDAYLIAYAVPYFLITIIAGALPGVLVPVYIRLRAQRGMGAASGLLMSTLAVILVVLGVLSALLMVGSPVYLPILASGFSPEKRALAASLTLVLAPLLLTSSLASVIGATLNAHDRFIVPALSPLITTVLGVVALVAAGSVQALAAGTLLGNVVEVVVLLAVLRSAGLQLERATPRISPQLREVMHRAAPTLVGSVLMASTVLIDQAMTSPMSAGSVAALSYATRLVTFPLSLTAAALGTVLLPYFSEMVSRRAWDEVRAAMGRYLRLVGVITVPIAALLVVFAQPLTGVLFARGAFGPGEVPVVAATVASLAIEVPFYTGVILLMRVALAMRLNVAIAAVSAVNVGVNVALNAVLGAMIGVAGIALSTSAVYACSFVLLFWVVRSRLNAARGEESNRDLVSTGVSPDARG